MTNERKHSLLPWVMKGNKIHSGDFKIGYLSSYSDSDSEFIIRACNSFYDMREALILARDWVDNIEIIMGGIKCKPLRALEIIDEALKKAGA